MKWRQSLLTRYLLIIIFATLLLPITFPLLSLLYYWMISPFESPPVYENGTQIEEMWHAEAKRLEGMTNAEINKALKSLKKTYSEAEMFWVDREGNLQWASTNHLEIPKKWDASDSIKFMKEHYDAEPFTVVAFIGGHSDAGFMVFQLPRTHFSYNQESLRYKYSNLIVIGTVSILAVFIFLSWLFFSRMRKRLLRLQLAMEIPADNMIPERVMVDHEDEIGQLETSFNQMIGQLLKSRDREQAEESLRRQLVANLSHDLRTPLTTLRGHLYTLEKEALSERGIEALEAMDRKITYISELIDNLQSYSLLVAGKYPYHATSVEMIRLIRQTVADWYPVFEREGFLVEIDLPEERVEWLIDARWFERVLDNLLQNVLRHAKQGKYIGIKGEQDERGFVLSIIDRGLGFREYSEDKGAGIGLSIVTLMLKELHLTWEIDTSDRGTEITIFQQRKAH